MKIPNIAVQLPRGYKLNFSKIICPKYDKPPKSIKILETDANVSFHNQNGFYQILIRLRIDIKLQKNL